MQLSNSKASYGWVAIGLHWIVAIGVIAMWIIGFTAGQAEDAHNMAEHRSLMHLHVSLGALLFLFAWVQIIWYYATPQPTPVAQAKPLMLLSKIVHHLLLLGIALQFLSGPGMIWAGAHAIRVFDWFAIPSPFSAKQEWLDNLSDKAHLIGRYMILVLFPIHALGAFKHLLIDKDNVVPRMLWPQKPKS